MTSAQSALQRCVGDVPTFVNDYWGRQPLHRPATNPAGFTDILSLGDIDFLINGSLAGFPDVTLVREGRPVDPAAYTREPDPRRNGARVIEPHRIYEHFTAGASIQLQGAQLRWPPLARFCRELELELTVPTQANVYITPPHSQGFDLHFDTHDVCILHLHGTKTWELHRPVIDDPLDEHHGLVDEKSGEPATTLQLTPGDVLYLPRGWGHRVRAEELGAAHLTLGFIAQTWMTALDDVIAHAASLDDFRKSLPAGFARRPAGFANELANKLTTLASWITELDPETAATWVSERYWATVPRTLNGQLSELFDLAEIDDDTELQQRPLAYARLVDDGDQILLLLGDTYLTIPLAARPAIDFVLSRERFRVGSLAHSLDEESRLVLCRRLVREGLLQRAAR